MFLLPLYLGYSALQAGWSVAAVTYGTVVFLWALVFVTERLMPYRESWNTPDEDILNDMVSGGIAYGLLPILLKPLYIAILAGLTVSLANWYDGSLWPSDWPIWIQLILLLLAGDAGRYWGHRLAHTVPFLWRFHAVHHSASRLWFFNAIRQHPVDKAWFTFTELFFPIILGASGDVLVLYFIATLVCGTFQHTNMDVKIGPLYYLFNIVDLHRWHHSKDIRESDNNYGNNLIVYDILFGTRYLPEDNDARQVADIGLINPDYPKNYLGQFLAPFRKGRLDKEQPKK
jgi:sterol desaturase/sphingolipid hydroxylase (fatty acid hydroxylase superfamily)